MSAFGPIPDVTPPPFPPGYGPPTTARRVISLICWIVILGISGLIFWTNLSMSARSAAPATAPSVAVNATPPPSPELELASRYSLGARTIVARHSPASGQAFPVATLASSVEQMARTPVEKLRVVPVIGELLGAPAAVERLDALKTQLAQPEADDARMLRVIYSPHAEAITSADRERLIQRHGWFGKLAVSHGRADSDPVRQSVLNAAARTFIATLLMIGFLLATLAAGLVLLVIALVRISHGRIRRTYAPASRETGPFLEAFAVYLAGFIGLSLIVHWVAPHVNMVGSAMVLPLFAPLPILWPWFRGVRFGELLQSLGWHTGRGILREIGAGLVGYITGVPVVGLGMLMFLILQRFSTTKPTHPIDQDLMGNGPHMIGLYFLACVMAPVLEETMFRGALYHHLRRRLGWAPAALIVAFLFAAIHPQGWTFIPVLGALAFNFAMIRDWRGSLIASITAHATQNFITLTFALLAVA